MNSTQDSTATQKVTLCTVSGAHHQRNFYRPGAWYPDRAFPGKPL